jgi:phage tail-like protein
MTAQAERWRILDAGAGWHDARRDNVVFDATGAVTLASLPGKATPIAVDTRKMSWRVPVDLAGNPIAGLFVLDGATNRILRAAAGGTDIDTLTRIGVLPTIGGQGSGTRQFRGARGCAVLKGSAVAVADTGNHRVLVFSRFPHALLHAWGARDARGRPAAGARELEFRDPWDVAATRDGTLYVADRGNARVQRIAGDGSVLEGLTARTSMDPTAVAVTDDHTAAVVDRARGAVWIFDSRRALPQIIDSVETPRSVAFSPGKVLYIGDAVGRIHVFRDGSRRPLWEPDGSAATGLDGSLERLCWWESTPPRLLAIIEQRQEDRDIDTRIWSLDPAGGRATEGRITLGPLDSSVDRCVWHRAIFDAAVPSGASIEISSATSDRKDPSLSPASADFTAWSRDLLAGAAHPDCLVHSAPGRWLWLRLVLRSNGQRAPVISRIRIAYPRSSYLQYLPAAYQEDDESREFLDRFLAIFQSGFDDFDAEIDRLPDLFDPFLVPRKHLLWLAGWMAVGVDPRWLGANDRPLREQLARAIAIYRVRGTPQGLVDAIRTYAHVEARVLEHFALRRWPRLHEDAALDGARPLWSRHLYQRLQLDSYSQVGDFRLTGVPEPALEVFDHGAHRFSVFFQSDPALLDDTRQEVARIVEQEKPAHTQAVLCPVFPRFRVGVQATVGIDTVVGTVSYTVLNKLATLNYDTILGCSPAEQTLRALGTAVRPVIGATTRVP